MLPGYLLPIVLETHVRVHVGQTEYVHVHDLNVMCTYYVSHTQSVLHLDAQQFLVVLMRCGGSEKKNRGLPSSVYAFVTLCTSSLCGLCNLTNRPFSDAPSKVAPMTCIYMYVCVCILPTAHTNSYTLCEHA